ncbi:uncharacterized protein LOC129783992 [Falco peregrinus]|uniref:uncharacterized protein LOC129783992 n=1 Tax=Falco peregrinus TaxID=8954 RepID=UPI002479BD9C|nr:uncharacterized protein LOC129783992 [Falco peregrinus]
MGVCWPQAPHVPGTDPGMSVSGAGSAGAPGESPGPAHFSLAHTGLLMAPCGCLFDPQVFCTQWTDTNLPPPATSTLSHRAGSLLGTALRGPLGCGTPPAWAVPGTPQGQAQHCAPFNLQGRAVASAPSVLLPCLPQYQDMEKQLAQLSLSGTATPVGAALGTNTLPGTNTFSHAAAHHHQAIGGPADDLLLLQEMMQNCSLVSQEEPSSIPVYGDDGDTGRAIYRFVISSLSLPAEMLSPDHSIPETTTNIPSPQQFKTIVTAAQDVAGCGARRATAPAWQARKAGAKAQKRPSKPIREAQGLWGQHWGGMVN